MLDDHKTYRTFGQSRAVRLADYDYKTDQPIHITICAKRNLIQDEILAHMLCENISFYCKRLNYELYGYCLMPDHLHVLFSPADSRVPISKWLDLFKSYTTNFFMKNGGQLPLWQRSAYDHICRRQESAQEVMTYIANNPVRAGFIEKWDDWRWTRVFVET